MCHWHCEHLCKDIPVTALIIEASYLTDICIYAPSLCTWNISQCDVYFLNDSHFIKFHYVALLSTWLNLEPSYLAQLCINTGATHREEIIMHLSIIFLKLIIFKKNSHFALFSWFDIYAKDTKFINGTWYTHRHMHTDTHRQIQIPFLHFTLFDSFGIHPKDTIFIFGIPQTYTCTHMYRDIDTHTDTHRHIMFVYIHKHTHTHTHWYACGKSKEIVSSNPLLSQNWPKLLL